MADLTRRGLLGAGGSLLGLAACNQAPTGDKPAIVTRDDRPAYEGEVSFEHGVASGDPLPSAVIVWTRVTPGPDSPQTDIPVTYRIYAEAGLETLIASGLALAKPGADFTVKIDAKGLSADTEYYFQFVAKTAGGEVASPVGRTKTTAASGDAPVRFAVISCANYPFGQFHVYREISQDRALDAVIHLGDYIYEYGLDGYGGDVGQQIERNHEPPLETVTLDDYRTRHAQYKTDSDLQAAHAAAPWLCTWDDHESTNDSYRNGAENHNPEENEGNWSDRKQAAVQAYLEWMPVRDPVPGMARESIYRRFDFGDVASVMCLESRLTGRSDEISWFKELAGLEPAQVPMAAVSTMTRVNDETRTMLGQVQEDWLAAELADSVTSGKAWQVLANQVIMAKVRAPNFSRTLSQNQIDAQDVGYIQQLIPFSQLGLPWNLDAWDGFPAARDRLYAGAKAASATLVTLTGDTHTAWANQLFDKDGERRGVEFGCTSVTSPGLGTYVRDVDDLGEQFTDANEEVTWFDPNGNGWTLLTLTKDAVSARFNKVSDVTQPSYSTEVAATFVANRVETGLSDLEKQ
ncbi:MAG: alkaline phosphatase D family protein [Pseudomonadota bacterium]